MDRARLDSWLEQALLGLVCLILVLSPWMFGSTSLYHFQLIQALVVVSLVVWCARFWTRSEYRILWPPFAWAVLVFFGYVIWQYTRADVEYVARMELHRVILYSALFFLILDNFNKQEWTQFLICTVVFVGMAMSMYAVYQFTTDSHSILGTPQPIGYRGRAGGPFVCPNHLAGYLAMVLPLGFALTLMARLNIVLKILIGYAAVVMLAGLFVTISRAGYVAAGLGLVALFTLMLFTREVRIPAAVALVLLLIPAVWVAGNSIRAQTRLKRSFREGALVDVRFMVWPVARELWHENFWTGVGPAHFDIRFRERRPADAQMQVRPNRVHNDYLNMLADYGFVGFSIAAAAWGIFWISVLRIWRYVRRGNDLGSRQSTRAAIVLGASIGLLASLAHLMFDFDSHIPGVAILMITLLAVVTSHWRFATERFWLRPGFVGRLVASLICLAAAGWLGFHALKTTSELRQVRAAERYNENDPQYLAHLQRAFEIDPKNPETPFLIGEYYRRQSWAGAADYEKQAKQAIEWFDKAIPLDPFLAQPLLAKGQSLHWLGKHDEAWPLFRKAMLLDPNSYYTRAHFGWHFIQLRAWRPAYKWFMYSLFVKPTRNPVSERYMALAKRKMEEEAAETGVPVLSIPLPPTTQSDDQENSTE